MKRVVVHLERDGDIEKLSAELRKLGGIVRRAIPKIGIFGELPENAFEAMKGMAGVKYVREEHGYQIPPADEKVPQ